MNPVVLKRFDHPDETRRFELGRFEVLRVGGMVLGRATYEPGWKWSTHVGAASGTPWCPVEHVGMVVSGVAKVLMKDGTEYTLKAGDVFHVLPGHDSWVDGSEPYVSIHFLGAGEYAAGHGQE